MTGIGTGFSNFGVPDEYLGYADQGFPAYDPMSPPAIEGLHPDASWQTEDDIRRLREKAGVKSGFMDQVKDFIGDPTTQSLIEGMGGGDVTQGGRENMSGQQAQQIANTYNSENARGPIPRLGALPRMPGRTRPVSVSPPAGPRPQPPYNMLRTDYGFPMTQKMTPSNRLKAKAKGAR